MRRQRCLGALAALALAFTSLSSGAGAADEPKLRIVSFGLFGGQRVFQREAAAAAEIVAQRFGGDATVRFNSRKERDATLPKVAATLQATSRGMDGTADILFVILT